MSNKLPLQTLNLTAQNIDKIAALFPNCITEMLDEEKSTPDHKVYKRGINFELLKQMLSPDVVDGDEAYEFTWVGKKASIVEANKPIRKTLRPCPAESKNWDDTENLYIEGDNLEVLKLLQESYLGKVKMIYIDPPYNTGNDFIYADDFMRSQDEENRQMGMYDEDENRLFKNNDSNGRFHSDWCSMMYSRLMLARNLLTDDGVIFISIDDNEVENLQKICSEIFGQDNFLSTFCWCTDGNFDNQAKIKRCHQYILAYAKQETNFPAPPVIDPSIPKTSKLYNSKIRNTIIKNGPKNPISEVKIPVGFPCDFEDGSISASKVEWPRYSNDITVNNRKTVTDVVAKTGWSSKTQLVEFINNGFQPIIDSKGQSTTFLLTKTGAIETVKNRLETQSHVISVLNNLGGSQKASVSLGSLSKYFDFPKPVELIKYLNQMNEGSDFICLDFFSGSATTAHAVMQLNAEDGGHRKFIMVQLPEPCDEKNEAYKAGYKTICDIGKERIRRAGDKLYETLKNSGKDFQHIAKNINTAPRKTFAADDGQTSFEVPIIPARWSKSDETAENQKLADSLDIGFRVFKLDDTNMKDVYYSAEEYSQTDLEDLESNIKEDRTDLDLLFGCLLDWGLPLSMPYRSEKIGNCTVHTYAPGDAALNVPDALIACFDSNVPENVIKEIAKRKPRRAVFRDSSFASSPEKINVFEIFKLYAPDTDVKVI